MLSCCSVLGEWVCACAEPLHAKAAHATASIANFRAEKIEPRRLMRGSSAPPHIRRLPSPHAPAPRIEQALIIAEANGHARVRRQLREHRVPQMKHTQLRGLI